MKITRDATLPAGPDEVFALVATQEYQQAKVETQAPGSTAEVSERGDTLVVRSQRSLPTREMPSAVGAIVGETLQIVEQQTWGPAGADGSRRADVDVTVPGLPLTMRGTIDLTPRGEGAHLAVHGDLTCTLPLVGRKIAEAAQPLILQSIDAEAAMIRERLS